MRLPFNHSQTRFLKAFVEALFDGTDMAISVDQVVDNLQIQMGLIGGTKVKELSLSITGASVLLGPFFNWVPISTRKRRIQNRLQNTRMDLLQDIARLRGLVYAAYFGHWDGASQEDNRDNPVFDQIDFTLPEFRVRNGGEVPLTLIEGRELSSQDFVFGDNLPEDIDIIVVGPASTTNTL